MPPRSGARTSIPTVALRFFNVYGPRQALSNPYTGVLAIFASRLLNGNRAARLRGRPAAARLRQRARRRPRVPPRARATDARRPASLNIGSGACVHRARDRRRAWPRSLGKPHLDPEITGKYRVGDIRHCFADIALRAPHARLRAQVALDDGLRELAAWLDGQVGEGPRRPRRSAELAARGLTL